MPVPSHRGKIFAVRRVGQLSVCSLLLPLVVAGRSTHQNDPHAALIILKYASWVEEGRFFHKFSSELLQCPTSSWLERHTPTS